MAYSTGMMNKRVVVAKRASNVAETFGKSGQPKYEILGTFWMAETFTKGVKAMHEGALDAYDTVMFRCRFNKDIDRWCLLQYRGKWYQITSFNEDYQENQIQITATELANQQVNIIRNHEIEVWGNSACTERPDGDVSAVYAQFNVEVKEDTDYGNSYTNFTVQFEQLDNQTLVAFRSYSFFVYLDGTNPIAAGTVIRLEADGGVKVMDKDNDYSFGRVV